MTSTIPSASSMETSSQPLTPSEVFEWSQQWYPVAIIDDIEPGRPHAIQLLGKSLVIWRDANQNWRCFEDACPHRLAPLSEGRVEADGTLLCAYHAWRFDATGQCVAIPQSKNKQIEAKNCQHQKACAIAYPTQQHQGLLWVWAEPGSEGQAHCQMRSPQLIEELENPSERVVQLFWSQRDLPYGWDYFMENVADPAHVPVSHHGIMGSRYTDANYYDMPRTREVSTQDGFAFGITNAEESSILGIHDFRPPCLMKISLGAEPSKGQLILVLYATPTRPGWCRHIGCQILIKNEAGKLPPGLGFFGLPMPDWLGHVLASLFLHQDLVFLHYQERTLGQRGRDRWLKEVYTPNPQDKMIITFRQWLAYRAGGGVDWDKACDPVLPPAESDKGKLFDVWSTHTKNCRKCQDALKNIDRVKAIAFVMSVLCFGTGIMIDARTVALTQMTSRWVMPPLEFWGLIGMGGVLAIAVILLQKFRRLFFVYHFEHSEND